MHRRDVLRFLAISTVFPALRVMTPGELFAFGQKLHKLAGDPESPLRTLNPHQNRTIVAACERIIPATETPGATAARVNLFIDKMLTDWYALPDRDRFLAGLADLDERSELSYAKRFVDTSAPEQTALLERLDDEVTSLRRDQLAHTIDAGKAPADPDQHWFAMLKFLTIWGYFTSEIGQTRELHLYPMPGRFDGCAPYSPKGAD